MWYLVSVTFVVYTRGSQQKLGYPNRILKVLHSKVQADSGTCTRTKILIAPTRVNLYMKNPNGRIWGILTSHKAVQRTVRKRQRQGVNAKLPLYVKTENDNNSHTNDNTNNNKIRNVCDNKAAFMMTRTVTSKMTTGIIINNHEYQDSKKYS